jgi:Spy/CpxP family protein refolding chaperone
MTNRLLLSTALLLSASLAPALAQDATPPPAAPPPAHDSRPTPAGRPSKWSQGAARPMHGAGDDRRGPHGMMHGDRGFGPGGMGMEGGMWWKNTAVATRIGLTADQQKKIGDLFTQSRMQLIDLHATLEKEQLLLQPLIDANPVDQAKALAQIDKIADTRASLEKTDAKMLLSIRGVLTPEQWTKLQAEHHGGPGGQAARGPRAQGRPGGPWQGGRPGPGQQPPAAPAPFE